MHDSETIITPRRKSLGGNDGQEVNVSTEINHQQNDSDVETKPRKMKTKISKISKNRQLNRQSKPSKPEKILIENDDNKNPTLPIANTDTADHKVAKKKKLKTKKKSKKHSVDIDLIDKSSSRVSTRRDSLPPQQEQQSVVSKNSETYDVKDLIEKSSSRVSTRLDSLPPQQQFVESRNGDTPDTHITADVNATSSEEVNAAETETKSSDNVDDGRTTIQDLDDGAETNKNGDSDGGNNNDSVRRVSAQSDSNSRKGNKSEFYV